MKNTTKTYDSAFREKAVLLSYQKDNLTKLEKELGLYRGALNKWREQYEVILPEDVAGKASLKKLTLEEKKIRRIKKRIEQSDSKFEILKNAGPIIQQGNNIIFEFISNNNEKYTIRQMCAVLGVNRCLYYHWKNNVLSKRQKRKIIIKEQIASIFFKAERRYGSLRIKELLQNSGHKISVTTVKKYMKELGLTSQVKKN